ncbi:MAG TPA: peptidylprolyl isomerase [Methylophilaceae bacterium]|jgi:peptidyl-prolyl cis-trans isomerase A (cyclophilin A)
MRPYGFLLLLALCSPPVLAEGMKNPQIEFQTNQGSFVVELYPDKAPKTVANFMQYVSNGFYMGTLFHRTIKRFMIQGGGLTPEMQEKSTFSSVPNESNNGLKNEPGTLAMARAFEPDSATSQFFINIADNKFLNYYKPDPHYIGYCVFGKVIRGMQVVERISEVPTRTVKAFSDVPVEPVVIEKVAVLETPVEAEALSELPIKSSKPASKGKKRGQTAH